MNQFRDVMRRVFRLLAGFCLWLFFNQLVAGENDSTSARHEILIKFKPAAFKRDVLPTATDIPLLQKFRDAKLLHNARFLFPKRSLYASHPLDGMVKVLVAPEHDLKKLLDRFKKEPEVEYAHVNHVYKIDSPPNDPLFPDQVSLRTVWAEAAWDVQLASPDIIVGVIDTGIDYTHEDLNQAMWLNPGEDLNMNGTVDSTDFNGIDDDGNGFVDDLRGWDFTDAQSFPDGGDFLDPDNDPMDENGHGTQVAGIIGAVADNNVGIAGLAFGCQIMNLRAGTSLGLLEEDDVASAIVYAVDNGVRILNMSFGDVVVSPLLRDVIQYAYNQGCVLVASAGNAATNRIHFPSGFQETISVGATTPDDRIAPFSNFGGSVDLVAPGVDILTTQIGGGYGTFSGTSASGPFVSATAALILSKIPQLPPAAVSGLLISSADDLGDSGWDNLFAAGRLNAFRAVSSPITIVAHLSSPAPEQGFSAAEIQINGTAAGPFLKQYILELGTGTTPVAWQELTRVAGRQLINETLFEMNTGSLIDTVYTLRLTVEDRDGRVEDKVSFFIDRTPPAISNIRQTPMLDGARASNLLEFETDDICNAALLYRPAGSNSAYSELKLAYQTREHRINLSQTGLQGSFEFIIAATNVAGLVSQTDNIGQPFFLDLTQPAVGGIAIETIAGELPSGFLLEKTADFDGDQNFEIVLNEYDPGGSFGPLKIFAFSSNGFTEIYSNSEILIPRDLGDADGDGLLEIFAGRGPASFIVEADTPGGLPQEIVWQDDNAWASRFADLDGDGIGEIIVRVGTVFEVRENSGDNLYTFVGRFPNLTPGSNGVGVPKSVTGDWDDDGRPEILFGDGDGDIYIYEATGDNQYELTWSDRMPLLDTIDYLNSGDFDGDGVPEFVVGCHSDPNLNTESTFDSRHWFYRIYKSSADDNYAPVWNQAFFGFQSPADFDAGVAVGDADTDNRDEILINVFPDFYIVDYNADRSRFETIWHTAPARSNSTVVADFDRDGRNEFFLNNGEKITGYRIDSGFMGPATPTGLEAHALGENAVALTWQHPGPVAGFRIYRGPDNQNLNPIALETSPTYIDTTVAAGTDFYYAVSAVDSSRNPSESLLSAIVRVRPGSRPFLEHAGFVPPNQVRVTFSEKMNPSVKNQTNYVIDSKLTPTSVIAHKGGREVIVTAPFALSPGNHTITVQNVADLNGTPIDTLRNSLSFEVPETSPAPYLVSATSPAKNLIELRFNEAMDAVTSRNADNYRIDPNVLISSAQISSADPSVIFLTLDAESSIGPFGVDYLITVKNLSSADGVPVRFGVGDSAVLLFSSADLSGIFAYPNPYRADSGQEFVTIAGLTPDATVKILDSNGRVLRTLQETDGNGGEQWDLRDDAGKPVASGIYLFYVASAGDRAVGKVAVIR